MNNENIDIINDKEVTFEFDPSESSKNELFVDEVGYAVRKTHSSFFGLRLTPEQGRTVFSHVDMYMPPKCYVKTSDIHEHGVFAAKDFLPGEVIEEMKTIILDVTENTNKDWVVSRYGMLWECDCDICKKNGKTYYLPTGNGMLYNHADVPNAYPILEKPFKRVKMVALRKIQKDEEITFYYGSQYSIKMKDISKLYPRPDLPEGLPAIPNPFIMQSVAPAMANQMKPVGCATCGSNLPVDGQINIKQQFRSMIEPERKL